MDFEKFLNEHKDKILRFEVCNTSFHIHLKDGGQVEIDTNSPFISLNFSYVVNK